MRVSYRQILNMLTLHQKDLNVIMVGLRALALLLKSGTLTLSSPYYYIFTSLNYRIVFTIRIRIMNNLVTLD